MVSVSRRSREKGPKRLDDLTAAVRRLRASKLRSEQDILTFTGYAGPLRIGVLN